MTKTALITGASAGIGLELARLFARDKYNLILVARREDALNTLAAQLTAQYGIACTIFAADLAAATAPEEIFAFTQSKNQHVDVLVNNAGFGAQGKFAELPLQKHLDMLQVNITSLVHLSGLYLPAMIQRRTGGILNVASTAAFVPGPLMAIYYATKAFVLSFSEALTNELQGTDVHASCLCPGATATEFHMVANMEKSKLFNGPLVMSASTVARMGYDGFNKNQAVVVCGVRNQVAVSALRFFPRGVATNIARRMQES